MCSMLIATPPSQTADPGASEKTLRGTPASFGEYRVSPESPRVVEIVAHMGDLIGALARRLEGESRWAVATPQAWEPEVARFFAALKRADDALAAGVPIQGDPGQTPPQAKFEFD